VYNIFTVYLHATMKRMANNSLAGLPATPHNNSRIS